MPTRSVLGLLYTVRGLKKLGEDPSPVLARHGLDLETIAPDTRIERAREIRIYAELAAGLRDPLAGLKLGTEYGLGGYGPLAMLLMTCDNAWQAFQTGIKYQELTFLFGTLSLEPGERESALVLTPMPMAEQPFRFRVDGEVAGTYKLLRDMQQGMGLDIQPERIEMPYPRPPEAAAYEAHFGCPVSFGHSQARFWLRNEHLQLRFPTADPTAHALFRTLCDQQLQAQRSTTGDRLADRVLAHLALFVQRYPSAAEVARSFDLAERSLRRQLQDEGTSFRELLARTRHDKARQLLTGSALGIEAVAQQLGYAEPAAFIHAFKGWTGMTPAAFRAQARAAGAAPASAAAPGSAGSGAPSAELPPAGPQQGD